MSKSDRDAADGAKTLAAADQAVRVLVLEHDPTNPPLLLGDWLDEVGAELEVRRLHAGDEVPTDARDWNALVSLGGAIGVYDDDIAPWLASTRKLLAQAVTESVPTLAVGLGAQLLAVAAGGRVETATSGYRIGAGLTAKRDGAERDLLFGDVPITPDVMQFHRDVITALPGGSELLLASLTDPIEAFRVGSAAWGMQFHIETTPGVLRAWRSGAGEGPLSRRELSDDVLTRSERRFGPALDEAAELMGQSWRAVAHRFIELVRSGIPQAPTGRAGPRLPLSATELHG